MFVMIVLRKDGDATCVVESSLSSKALHIAMPELGTGWTERMATSDCRESWSIDQIIVGKMPLTSLATDGHSETGLLIGRVTVLDASRSRSSLPNSRKARAEQKILIDCDFAICMAQLEYSSLLQVVPS